MIVITTPTGDIGARVLNGVLDAGREVRVIVRDRSKLSGELADRVESVEGSHADPEVIERALSGASRVFWLPPGDPASPDASSAYVRFSRAFAEAIPSSSVTHVVGVSALGRGWPKPAGLAAASIEMDDMIGRAGVGYRALACASLMDNIARQAASIRDDGLFHQPTPGDLKLPHVAKADVAATAVRLLVSDWRGVEDVALHGPESLSFEEMADTLSEVLARPVRFRQASMEDFAAMLRAGGASEGMTADYVDMFRAKNEGMDTMIAPSSRDATPTTFRQWCERELRPLVSV